MGQIKNRAFDEDGKIEIFRDKDDRDNPMDREEVKESHQLEKVETFNQILTSLSESEMKGMKVMRIPFSEEKALPVECFDMIVGALKDENPALLQCVFRLALSVANL